MRHRKRGRKLNRNGAHRKALKRNLAISLFEHEKIRTTPQKAKFAQPFVEKLITLAKKAPKGDDPQSRIKALHYRRQVISQLYDALVPDPEHEGYKKGVVNKLFDNIAPRYENRPGGYTRIVRLPKRRLGDNAELCLFELVEGEEVETTSEVKKGLQKKAKRQEKKKMKKEEAKKGKLEEKQDEESKEPAENLEKKE
ncbi:MAG: 50S ribosomal protein L17, partial [Planctomycetota bacterium]